MGTATTIKAKEGSAILLVGTMKGAFLLWAGATPVKDSCEIMIVQSASGGHDPTLNQLSPESSRSQLRGFLS